MIRSTKNSVKGSRGLCFEDCSLFMGLCQEMANYDTCMHFDVIGPRGPATLCIQVRLASSAGRHDGLPAQKRASKWGLVSSTFGENGSAHRVLVCKTSRFHPHYVLFKKDAQGIPIGPAGFAPGGLSLALVIRPVPSGASTSPSFRR